MSVWKNNQFFILILLTPTIKSFSHTLSWTSKRNYFISGIYTIFIRWITFFLYILYCHKSGRKLIFQKVYLPMKPTWRYSFLLFHYDNPPKKLNHQMASSRAKTRSTQGQTCMKYRGIIILLRQIQMQTQVIWKFQNMVDFSDVTLISPK